MRLGLVLLMSILFVHGLHGQTHVEAAVLDSSFGPNHWYMVGNRTVDDKVYVFGTRIPSGSSLVIATDTIHRFDVVTRQWSTLGARMPISNVMSVVTVPYLDSCFYVQPGFTNGDAGGWGSVNKVIKVAPQRNAAEVFASFPQSAIWGVGACAANGRVYYFGGHTGGDQSAIAELDPSTGTLTTVASMSSPSTQDVTFLGVDGWIYYFSGIRYTVKPQRFHPVTKAVQTLAPSLPFSEVQNTIIAWYLPSEHAIYFAGHGMNPTLYRYDLNSDVIASTGTYIPGRYGNVGAIRDEHDPRVIYAFQADASGYDRILTRLELKSSVSLPFTDTFDTGRHAAWRVNGTHWSFTGGKAIASTPTTYIAEQMFIGDSSWRDYSFEVDVYGTAGPDKAIGVRVTDANNYYNIHLIGPDGGYHHLDINRVQGGSATILYRNSSFSVLNNTLYRVRVDVEGNRLKVYVNGTLEATVVDDAFPHGGVGLFGGSGGYAPNTIQYDNVAVTPLTSTVDPWIVQIDSTAGMVGDTIVVPLRLHAPSGASANAVEGTMRHAGDQLQCVGWDTVGTILSSLGWSAEVNITGEFVRLAAAGATAINGDPVLIHLRYLPIGPPCHFAEIVIDSATIDTTSAGVRRRNGGIQIAARPVFGDVDLNGTIQAFDAALVLKAVVGDTVLACQSGANADVTVDGSLSALDATGILMQVVGSISAFPYVPPIGGGQLRLAATHSGQLVRVDVNLSEASEVLALEAELVFDPAALTFNDSIWPPDARRSVKIESGRVRFAAALTNPMSTSGTIATFLFAPAGDVQGTTVRLQRTRLNERPRIVGTIDVPVTVTSVQALADVPADFSLDQNYPNPFNPSTVITYSVPSAGYVSLRVYDMLGRVVAEMVGSVQEAGRHSVTMEVPGLPSGVYVYELRAGGEVAVKKMILQR
jgi:hypothetical protein